MITIACIHCGYPGTPHPEPKQAIELYITHLVDQHWNMLELTRAQVVKVREDLQKEEAEKRQSEDYFVYRKGEHWQWVPLQRVGQEGAKFAMIYECACGCGETFQPEDELKEER